MWRWAWSQYGKKLFNMGAIKSRVSRSPTHSNVAHRDICFPYHPALPTTTPLSPPEMFPTRSTWQILLPRSTAAPPFLPTDKHTKNGQQKIVLAMGIQVHLYTLGLLCLLRPRHSWHERNAQIESNYMLFLHTLPFTFFFTGKAFLPMLMCSLSQAYQQNTP